VKSWTSRAPGAASPGASLSPNSSTAQLVNISHSVTGAAPTIDAGLPALSTSQKKRIKAYLKRCRLNPRHTQLNLEGYLLLPVQRIPRYKLLVRVHLLTCPVNYADDKVSVGRTSAQHAANTIWVYGRSFGEGPCRNLVACKQHERRKAWIRVAEEVGSVAITDTWKVPQPARSASQVRTVCCKGAPTMLTSPRRLIMDGSLRLTRVVRKAVVSFEAFNAQGDASTVQVDCLAPELTPRPLVGILCNDLLVLCRDPSEGKDPNSPVDLWAVLRMQTLPQPASIVHGNGIFFPSLSTMPLSLIAWLWFSSSSGG